jgi:heme-degrading monooxygenase HmoA
MRFAPGNAVAAIRTRKLSGWSANWHKISLEADMTIAHTPAAPYYAVIFTSTRTDGDNGYETMAEAMVKLAAAQPGFLGIESARDALGITVSYWDSLEAIAAWKQNSAHLVAQRRGHDVWYETFKVRICRVERDYAFNRQ